MKNEDYAEGIYWIMRAIAHREGVGYDASSGIDYRNDVFESFHFWSHDECTCLDDHAPDCPLRDYGFKHFASGLEVDWYKHVGRSTESNLSLTALDWYKIVVECIESVRDHDYREVFGSAPEAWRDPLGALILTLAGDPDNVDVRRAQVECRELTRVLNEK